ncbi:MAG TPA: FtsX-like permease family protein [Gammaproteobacteria bacterium]
MLTHYLALALRNARRTPLAAAMNVLTLALGLACFLIAYAAVAFWNHAERGFANADRIYVLTIEFARKDGSFGRPTTVGGPPHVHEYLRADFPQLERIARATLMDPQTAIAAGDRAVRLRGLAVDPEFLEIFDLPFAAGDARAALAAPRSVVLTRATAARLFGDAAPLGRPVLIDNVVEATVTGVVDAPLEPSHLGRAAAAPLRFDMLASFDVRDAVRAARSTPEFIAFTNRNWTDWSVLTYMLLPRDGSVTGADLVAHLEGFAARHVPEEVLAGTTIAFGAVPVRAVLRRGVDEELFSRDVGVSVTTVLWWLGALVLAVACLNYANLATARAARRTREVGLRRALGARPSQVIAQHLLEAALATGVALVAAAAALALALPALDALLGADVGAVLLADPAVWLGLPAVAAAVTLAAGAYPAFALARLAPVEALRAAAQRIGPKRLWTLLVGLQFAAAAFLLAVLTVTAEQNAALVRTALGAVTDPLVLIENRQALTQLDSATLHTELARVPQVTGVTEMAGLPWQRLVAVAFVTDSPEAAVPRRVLTRPVGFDFFDVMGMELLAGRTFSRARGEDRPDAETATPGAADVPRPVVVDRAFVEEFGFGSPADAIDRLIYYAGGGPGGRPPPLRIVGVVENQRLTFRGGGARSTIYPLETNLDVTVARVAASDVAGALDGIDAAWQRLSPAVAISRRFFDETFEQGYETFLRINRLFGALALTAVAISAAGLFGLATLVAGRRRREIGVRKACGASDGRIVRLLLGSFARPVLLGNAIAWPLAYAAAEAYLDVFLHPVPLTAAPFAAALATTLAVACVAVGGQSWRAARTRPAEVLRHE